MINGLWLVYISSAHVWNGHSNFGDVYQLAATYGSN